MEPLQDPDLTGQTIGRYSIVALIAVGGQGRVYRGRDQRLRRDVAVKVLTSEQRRCEQRRSLIQEARALSLLNHPHVAGVYDFLTSGGRDFMVMEFVPGATLRDMLAAGPLPPGEVLRLGTQLARGLSAAHAANVVHCDIKPGNIKITSHGDLKILDFGLAKLLPTGMLVDSVSHTSAPGAIAGTVPYMSPEQLRGNIPDRRSDIFAVGAVLYEMATGCRAFPQRDLAGLIEAVQHVDPVPPTIVNPLVPLALEPVIMKALEKEPAYRQQAAVELADTLDQLMHRAKPGDTPGTLATLPAELLARVGGV